MAVIDYPQYDHTSSQLTSGTTAVQALSSRQWAARVLTLPEPPCAHCLLALCHGPICSADMLPFCFRLLYSFWHCAANPLDSFSQDSRTGAHSHLYIASNTQDSRTVGPSDSCLTSSTCFGPTLCRPDRLRIQLQTKFLALLLEHGQKQRVQ